MRLKVSACTISTNGGFVVTLKAEGEDRIVVTPLGEHPTKGQMETYYIKILKEVVVDTVVDLDMNDYVVKARPFTKDDGIVIDCKWLHHK